MTVKTLHTVFARGVSFADPIDIHVDRMQAGRSFASSTVTISQGDRLCVRSSVLMSATEPDLIRHSDVLAAADRKSVVEGKSVSVRVDPGGRRICKKKNKKQ